ncbi:MAG: glycine cleavage system protein H [Thermoanaerobaculia bacterium]
MFPGIYDFDWNAGHLVFLGIFYAVLLVVAATMVIAVIRAVRGMRVRRVEALRWHADFEDLPARARACRHELTGEVETRVCGNGFDCRHCADHPRFVAAHGVSPTCDDARVAGFEVPRDRRYHRGHTWVRQEEDGLLTIGLDDLGAHLLGRPEKVSLPAAGTRLVANGTGWEAVKNGIRIRVLAPVDGEVVAVGGADEGWWLRVKPDGDAADTRHLLSAAEARPWMLREVERLQLAVAPEGIGATLADGGLPVDDLSAAIPRDVAEDVYGMMFLHP